MRIRVDPKVCVGSSNCVEVAPEAYEIGEDGLARVRLPAADEAIARAGAEACPVSAIELSDDTGRRIFP